MNRHFREPSILSDLKTNEKSLTLANINATNEDDPAFFKNLPDHLQDFEGDQAILMQRKIKKWPAKTHYNAQETMYDICDNLDQLLMPGEY